MLVDNGTMADFHSICNTPKCVEKESLSGVRYSIEIQSAEVSTLQKQHAQASASPLAYSYARRVNRVRDKPFINFIPLPYCTDQPANRNTSVGKLSLPRLQAVRKLRTVKEIQSIEM